MRVSLACLVAGNDMNVTGPATEIVTAIAALAELDLMAASQPVGGRGRTGSQIEGMHLIVASAHLDDAFLSCAALMRELRRVMPVSVVTLFSEGGDLSTLSGRQFARQCAFSDVGTLYEARRAEDIAAARSLGVEAAHLNLVEALYRRKPVPANRALGLLSTVVPEFAAVYPTYRWHVSAGKVSGADDSTLRVAAEALRRYRTPGRVVVLCPLGIGGHVDHVLTRRAVEAAFAAEEIVYYADQPYALHGGAEDRTPPHVNAIEFRGDQALKAEALRSYGTQVAALFPQGIPELPELYLAAAP
ncbi:N-acetylglucosaminyl deacetylase, LmbE family [Frankineae bacterium MT45]|nr:N-acetylglucosaminyl deacetylase, LmbE family [Frankineae bacterium MT45]